jgi:hypothetical protein
MVGAASAIDWFLWKKQPRWKCKIFASRAGVPPHMAGQLSLDQSLRWKLHGAPSMVSTAPLSADMLQNC